MHNDNSAPAPIADSPEDVLTRTIPLDGGTAIVEHLGDRVEVTVRIGHRLTAALVLSPAEASALGTAIARPDGPTLDDLFTVADAMHADAAELVKHWGTARDTLTDHLELLDERGTPRTRGHRR